MTAVSTMDAVAVLEDLPTQLAPAGEIHGRTSKTLVPEWDRQFRLIRTHHEHREELGRLRLAGIGADAVAVAGQLGEALSGSRNPVFPDASDRKVNLTYVNFLLAWC
jgi:hypothetical protein